MIRRLRTRLSLFRETAAMALDTLWANKLRSVLTVLGVVIGITSIVGMTALIRGFDESLKDSIRSLGPKTIFVQRFGAVSFSSGTSFLELMRRPSLNADDGEAIRRLAPSVALVDTWTLLKQAEFSWRVDSRRVLIVTSGCCAGSAVRYAGYSG